MKPLRPAYLREWTGRRQLKELNEANCARFWLGTIGIVVLLDRL